MGQKHFLFPTKLFFSIYVLLIVLQEAIANVDAGRSI